MVFYTFKMVLKLLILIFDNSLVEIIILVRVQCYFYKIQQLLFVNKLGLTCNEFCSIENSQIVNLWLSSCVHL